MSYGEVIDNMPLVLTALFFIVPAYYYFFGKPLDCSKVKRDVDVPTHPPKPKDKPHPMSWTMRLTIANRKGSGIHEGLWNQ